MAQNCSTRTTFTKVLLHKNFSTGTKKSSQELAQELKKYHELAKELNPASGTKSGFSETKLRTLLVGPVRRIIRLRAASLWLRFRLIISQELNQIKPS